MNRPDILDKAKQCVCGGEIATEAIASSRTT